MPGAGDRAHQNSPNHKQTKAPAEYLNKEWARSPQFAPLTTINHYLLSS